MRFFAIGILVLLVTGCGSTPNPKPEPMIIEEQGGFRVSVKSNGREVKDFESDLVHHVLLNSGKVAEAKTELRAVSAQDAVDQFGKRYGFRISGSSDTLGLRPRDIVTATGKKSAPTLEDLVTLVGTLPKGTAEAGEAPISFTFDREGRPHKTILLFGKGGS